MKIICWSQSLLYVVALAFFLSHNVVELKGQWIDVFGKTRASQPAKTDPLQDNSVTESERS